MVVTATFRKSSADAPDGFFAVEAAGLRWLASSGAVAVPEVVAVDRTGITLERVAEAPPTRATAQQLGRALAAMHRSGASHHGAPPASWPGDGFIATLPLPHRPVDDGRGWGAFYAEARLAPYLARARDAGAVDAAGARTIDRVCARLADGSLGLPAEQPSRLHGDLWTGNVLWSPAGPVLIDPAAHGGHRETDLAMLALFGLPHLDDVLAAYHEAWPLADGWRDRVGLHQLHPLLVHAALFGGGYGARAVTAAARWR